MARWSFFVKIEDDCIMWENNEGFVVSHMTAKYGVSEAGESMVLFIDYFDRSEQKDKLMELIIPGPAWLTFLTNYNELMEQSHDV